MASESEQNAAFHDQLAGHYDSHLTRPQDVLARAAFQSLVFRHVPAGSTLLDFGCGTGIDALEYAAKGYRVLAYDNSPGMARELERRCAKEIAKGKILPVSRDYQEFLHRWPDWPNPGAVTANFAVLNSIRDLSPLFEMFAGRLAPPGMVIVSVLNPVHWTKLREPRWWLRLAQARRRPVVHQVSPYVSYLHFIEHLQRAAPQFQLVGRANAGALVRYDEGLPQQQQLWWGTEGPQAGPWAQVLWSTPAYRMLGHFVFLVLRRDG
jgi:SAM-dependent methyltransferase